MMKLANDLSTTQSIILLTLSSIAGILSLIGSGAILWFTRSISSTSTKFSLSRSVRRSFIGRSSISDDNSSNDNFNSAHQGNGNRNNGGDQFIYLKLIRYVSIMDIIITITFLLQPWLAKSSEFMNGFIGTQQTCSALGFFSRYVLGGAMMNCYLAAYFMLKIRYNKPDFELIPYLNPAIISAFVIPTIFGIVGVATGSFNPLPDLPICDYGPYPPGCDVNEQVECERGENYFEILETLYTIGLVIATVVAISCMISMVLYVRNQLRKSSNNNAQRYYSGNNHTATSSIETSTTTILSQPSKERIMEVTMQSVLYTLAFFNGMMWTVIVVVVYSLVNFNAEDETRTIGDPGFYSLIVLGYTFFPLQGFFNYYTFERSRKKRANNLNKKRMRRRRENQQRRQQDQRKQQDHHQLRSKDGEEEEVEDAQQFHHHWQKESLHSSSSSDCHDAKEEEKRMGGSTVMPVPAAAAAAAAACSMDINTPSSSEDEEVSALRLKADNNNAATTDEIIIEKGYHNHNDDDDDDDLESQQHNICFPSHHRQHRDDEDHRCCHN